MLPVFNYTGNGQLSLAEETMMQVKREVLEIKDRKLTIDLPESFVNHRVEVLVVTLDDAEPARRHRRPPPQFAGKVRETGDVMSSVPAADWGLAE
ncbi:hypothetical protein [Thermithiobacillus plumbiphilus]|uniref:Uncharacterized protein n=1 Tax=Thermithiobacillus plumbiphilus TaxID=1729899 RepID=A0ABU9D4J6_9PROT